MLNRHWESLAMKSPLKLWEWMKSRERMQFRRGPAQSSVGFQHFKGWVEEEEERGRENLKIQKGRRKSEACAVGEAKRCKNFKGVVRCKMQWLVKWDVAGRLGKGWNGTESSCGVAQLMWTHTSPIHHGNRIDCLLTLAIDLKYILNSG